MAKRLLINKDIFYKRIILIVIIIVAVVAGWTIFGNRDVVIDLMLGQQAGSEPPKPVNILLLGTDKGGMRADTIMMAGFDPSSGKASLLQIPRDTYVVNKRNDKKINSAYFSGFQTIANEVYSVAGVKPEKYLVVDFEGLRKIVDEIGGVEVDVPFDMKYDDPEQNLHIDLKKGVQVLDGKKAEQFVRYRKSNDGKGYAEGDLGRVNAQKNFIKALLNKALSGGNIFKVPKLISIATTYTKGNLTQNEMLKYLNAIRKIKQEDIQFMTLPGEPKYFGHGWYFVVDKPKAREMMAQHFTYSNTTTATTTPDVMKVDGQGIKIEVLNATGTPGVEQTYKQILGDMGFDVVKADVLGGMTYSKSAVIEHKWGTVGNSVAEAIGGAEVSKDLNVISPAQVTVIIGMDKID